MKELQNHTAAYSLQAYRPTYFNLKNNATSFISSQNKESTQNNISYLYLSAIVYNRRLRLFDDLVCKFKDASLSKGR